MGERRVGAPVHRPTVVAREDEEGAHPHLLGLEGTSHVPEDLVPNRALASVQPPILIPAQRVQIRKAFWRLERRVRGRRRQVHEERLHVRLVIEYGLHGKVVELEAAVARSGCGARGARVLPPVMRRAGRVVDRDDALAVRAGSLCQVVFSSRKEDEALIKAAACRYVPPAAHPEMPLARVHCAVSSRLELG